MNIGEAIKDARKKVKMSQQDVASKAGITQAALSNIEKGTRPGEETLQSICKVLGIPVAVLYIMALERSDFGNSCTDREWSLIMPIAQVMLLSICEQRFM